MKIIYVITKANWGGAQRYVYDLATAAKKRGHEVVVIHGAPGLLTERLTVAGVRTIALPELTRDINVFSDWRVFRAFFTLFKKEKPDVVHVNSSKAGGTGALAARLARVPRVIFTAHGWAFNEARPWWQKVPIALLHGVTVLLTTATICVSESIRKDIAWVPGTRKKLVVIRHGIEKPLLKTRNEARALLVSTQTPTQWIGMLAELHPTKRVRDAVEAFCVLAKNYPDTCLVVIGEGSEREHIEHLITARGMQSRIFLAGFVPAAETYLNAFDIFLFPSRSEALGYALIEAGFAGLPVIASKVGGIPEIIDDGRTGLLVAPGNPEFLAARLKILLADPGYARKLGDALREKVESEFALDRMLAETFAIYTANRPDSGS